MATIAAAVLGLAWGIATGFFDVARRDLEITKRELRAENLDLQARRDEQSKRFEEERLALQEQIEEQRHAFEREKATLEGRLGTLRRETTALKAELQEVQDSIRQARIVLDYTVAEISSNIPRWLHDIEEQSGLRSLVAYINFGPSSELGVEPSGDALFTWVFTSTKRESRQVAVDRGTVIELLNEFDKYAVGVRTTREYLPASRRLYDTLVAPFANMLDSSGIDTILFVLPDPKFPIVPLAALHDGEQFLAQQYNIGIIPSFALFNTADYQTGINGKILVVAPPTAGYDEENLLPGHETKLKVLANDRVDASTFKAEMVSGEYEAAHFILRQAYVDWDGAEPRVHIWFSDGIETVFDDPDWDMSALDLMVFETDLFGIDRATAGVALQRWADPILANRIAVKNKSRRFFMTKFYEGLQSMSKIEALVYAQREMLKDLRYRHPAYWAGFVLLGDPW